MKLGKCPECGEIINLDDIEELEENDIVGCGLMEGAFEFCDDCPCEYDDMECKRIRTNDELSITTAGEYNDGIS